MDVFFEVSFNLPPAISGGGSFVGVYRQAWFFGHVCASFGGDYFIAVNICIKSLGVIEIIGWSSF